MLLIAKVQSKLLLRAALRAPFSLKADVRQLLEHRQAQYMGLCQHVAEGDADPGVKLAALAALANQSFNSVGLLQAHNEFTVAFWLTGGIGSAKFEQRARPNDQGLAEGRARAQHRR